MKRKMKGYCTKPDRHEPKLLCGYPHPCPWHSGAPKATVKQRAAAASKRLVHGILSGFRDGKWPSQLVGRYLFRDLPEGTDYVLLLRGDPGTGYTANVNLDVAIEIIKAHLKWLQTRRARGMGSV